MKVFLLVCLGLLLVVSSGWGDAAVDKEDELSLKSLDTPALKDPSAGIPALRNIREAAKKQGEKGNDKNAKKKTSKGNKNRRKKKNGNRKTSKKNKGKSVNGKKNQSRRKKNQKRKSVKNKKTKNKNKRKSVKKNKSKKQTKRKSVKENKDKNAKPAKAKKNNKNRKSKTGKIKKKNKKSKKGKTNERKSSKEKKARKKIKNLNRRKSKSKKSKKGKAGRSNKPQGRLTCGSTQVNDTCLQNAVDALNFEKNQIQNFFKQKARLINHNKTTASKQGKKGEFEDAAKYLLQAIGGNLSAPTCGESGTAQKARSAKSASDTYKTLLNCSVSIKEACTMPTKTFNATIQATLDTCAGIYNISKMTSDTCRTESAFLSNGTLACECWSKAAIGIVLAKKNNCAATDTAKAVKKAKNKCIAAFSVCKKAEDSAVGLIHTCMAGEVKNISATGEPIPSPVAASAPVPAPIPAPVSVPAPVPVPVPVTAILTTVTTTPAPDCKCGIKKTRRIVGGKETEINEYPWMAAITNAVERFFCGGTLITSQWVLTATHCMWKDQEATQEVGVTEIRVVLGDHDNLISDENIIPRIVKEVSQIERHPKYSYVTSDYDIALIKLKDEVDLKVYTPACLPLSGDTFVGQKAWVYGWGTTSFGGSVSNKLLEVQVPVVSNQLCKQIMQNTITNRMLCAGGELNKDGCQGDSGGPLTVEKDGKHYLIGDVSFGNGCGQQGQYGVYGNVAFFRDTFINTTIEDAKNCP